MTPERVLEALQLPADCVLGSKVPKQQLSDHGATTAADRKQIRDAVVDVRWEAALKPQTIGVPAYRDDQREYLEVSVLSLQIRPDAKADRIARIVHRAIPYPVLLLAGRDNNVEVSVVQKRRSEADVSRVVLEREPVVAAFNPDDSGGVADQFLQSLALGGLPADSMLGLYSGIVDRLVSLLAAKLIGRFSLSPSEQVAAERLSALDEVSKIDSEIEKMMSAAKMTKQIATQAELNLKVKQARAARSEAFAILSVQ